VNEGKRKRGGKGKREDGIRAEKGNKEWDVSLPSCISTTVTHASGFG